MKMKSSSKRRGWMALLGGAAVMLFSSGCVVEERGYVAYGPANPYPDPYFASYWGGYDTGVWGYRGRRYYHGRTVWRPNSYYRHGGVVYHDYHGGGGSFHGGGGRR